jgi:NAD-dependent deacetylase
MSKPKILFFTGAGISAESGLQTFRDSKNGLWNNFKIEDVCTPAAWENNPSLVLDFYNQRRKQCREAKPNLAHELIAKLESHYEVTVVTQNVDNLHERAGSTKVIHLHGELMKVRSTVDSSLIYHREDDILLGDLCEKQSQLRPHIVWFGEGLDNDLLDNSIKEAMTCSVCVVVGTSLQVYPANTLPDYVPFGSQMIVIDPMINKMDFDEKRDIQFISKNAVEGMQMVYQAFNLATN